MKALLPFEMKSVGEMGIEGLGSASGNVDLGGDIVVPGAFASTLKEHQSKGTMPAMLWQHDSTQPIGIWTEMEETRDGLWMKGEFADTELGRDARTLAKMKAVGGLSIGFALRDFDYDKAGNRLIKEVDLWETSIVTFPMNPKATIEAVKADPRAFEKHLRDCGCSKAQAREAIHDAISGVRLDDYRCDADEEKELAKEIAHVRERLLLNEVKNYTRRFK